MSIPNPCISSALRAALLTAIRPRTFTFFTIASLAGTYMILKSRTVATKQQEKAAGDYSVTVDRSGMLPLIDMDEWRFCLCSYRTSIYHNFYFYIDRSSGPHWISKPEERRCIRQKTSLAFTLSCATFCRVLLGFEIY